MTIETLETLVYMRKACEQRIKTELMKRGLSEEAAKAISTMIAMEAEHETRKHFSESEHE